MVNTNCSSYDLGYIDSLAACCQPYCMAQAELYKATILKNGGVQIDFNMEETNRYATSFLDHLVCVTRSAEVAGMEGKVVELLKTNIGPDKIPPHC